MAIKRKKALLLVILAEIAIYLFLLVLLPYYIDNVTVPAVNATRTSRYIDQPPTLTGELPELEEIIKRYGYKYDRGAMSYDLKRFPAPFVLYLVPCVMGVLLVMVIYKRGEL